MEFGFSSLTGNVNPMIKMPKDDLFRRAIATLLARCILGLIFLLAGSHKIFVLGPVGHAQKYFLIEPYYSSFLPISGTLFRWSCHPIF